MRPAQRLGLSLWLLGFVCQIATQGRGHWTELNIGPFYIYTESDTFAAREALTQLEQVRWVLGGLLESKDLPSLWPIRVVFTNSAKESCAPEFFAQPASYILICRSGARLPLDQIAGILLDANTPRLPDDVESGLRQLLGTLEAKGSRVSWGGPPAHPDLAWARMQLFATKFEYSSSFHIFLAALKSGSTVRAAEQNAFGKDSATLEREAAANLASRSWETSAVSGRPLDPKRDFGEHALEGSVVETYLSAPGNEGPRLSKAAAEEALRKSNKSAPVYLALADDAPADKALGLLKTAQRLNPLWAEPVFRQAQLTSDPAEKEALLKKAVQLDPRNTAYWIELAQFQTAQGEATAAQGSWLRAENSASADAERARVHQLRVDSEQQRLDAAEEAQRREREAVHLSDEHAQQAGAERIRAAEQRANAAKDAAAGDEKPEAAVPWSDLAAPKKLSGVLRRVDCLGNDARLTVRDAARA
ncbi:MAG: hypothetical protein JO091_09180, partial [Acidobacteriaceae bacterium]|nr:hypothetical protein [Acidobacteriaceae bacterium]